MSFETPLVLIGLLVLIPIAFVMRRSEHRTHEAAAAFRGTPPQPSYFVIRIAAVCIFFAALIVVAARPFIAYDKSAKYLFVVDVSRSMQARFSCSEPTFLGRAKKVIAETIDAIPEAEVGFIAFDRFAFPVSHMTTDRTYLHDVLEHGLYVGLMLNATKTEIANALSVVAEKRQRLPDIFGAVTHVVLLSDGHVGGDYRRRIGAPLSTLRASDVKVSTVGIGNRAATPITDNNGGQCINQHLEVSGDKVMIPLRADILKFIATEGGGDYFTENETDRLIQSLRVDLERRPAADSGSSAPHRDVSAVFIALATLALLVWLYLPASVPRLSRLLAKE